MNPETEPTIVEETESLGDSVSQALESLLERVPFLDKGIVPFVCALVLFVALYYQSTALFRAVSSDIAVNLWKPVPATVLDQGLRYRYVIGNRRYESTSFGLEDSDVPAADVADWARAHARGSRVAIYVDPSEPERAAIDPRPTLSQALLMLVSTPFVLLGLSGALIERIRSRIHFERVIAGWGLLTLLIFAAGHALTVPVCIALMVYFCGWYVTYRHAHKKWVSDIEENVDAPPMDIRDFGP